jgi:hypothetical protein
MILIKENKLLVQNIIRDLQKGYGVEYIAVQGTATQKQTQHVIELMRKNNMLNKFYKTAKRKWKTNASNNDSGKRE